MIYAIKDAVNEELNRIEARGDWSRDGLKNVIHNLRVLKDSCDESALRFSEPVSTNVYARIRDASKARAKEYKGISHWNKQIRELKKLEDTLRKTPWADNDIAIRLHADIAKQLDLIADTTEGLIQSLEFRGGSFTRSKDESGERFERRGDQKLAWSIIERAESMARYGGEPEHSLSEFGGQHLQVQLWQYARCGL